MNLLLKTIIILTITLGLANLIATNILATQGKKLNQLNQSTASITDENHRLEDQLSHLKSLSSIEAQAKTLGLVRVNKFEVITTTDVVASLPGR